MARSSLILPKRPVPPVTAEPAPAPAPRRGDARPGRADRVVRRRPGFAGSIGAVLLLCASLTPSLLPRQWLLQGLVSGISMAIGYGAAASLGTLIRRLAPALPAVTGRGWAVLVGASAILVAAFLPLAESWQREVNALIGVSPPAWNPVFVLVSAALVAGLLVLVARLIRLLSRKLVSRLSRRLPRPIAATTAVAIMATAGFGLGYGVGFHGFVDATGRSAAAANAALADDLVRPDSPYLSGGAGSLVSWQTLGRQGRAFVAGAAPEPELARFRGAETRAETGAETGAETKPPIRVYVGRDSAPELDQRVRLAVRELARTGAFDRQVLAVVSTTGTGWVNPAVGQSLEYLHGGDTALVAMQYSYLPSWVSFLSEQRAAAQAAEALITAVRAQVAALPPGERPTLAVYGESLGAYGAETAFGGLSELAAGVDAALLVGPPHRSPIWRELTRERDAGSPMWRPAYQGGELVQFAHDGADLADPGTRPQVVYLQNPSDPIVWWSPQLLYRPPDWLDGPRGPDVSGQMRWLPVVTFWQVTVDLLAATKVPSGHGHSYRDSVVDAWVALVAPPDWQPADTDRLRALLD